MAARLDCRGGTGRKRLSFRDDRPSLAIIGPMTGGSAPDGLPVTVVRTGDNRIEASRRNDGATIRQGESVQLFLGLGLLAEGLVEGGDVDVVETTRFDMEDPTIDMSQGSAVLTVGQSAKKPFQASAAVDMVYVMRRGLSCTRLGARPPCVPRVPFHSWPR